MPSYIVFTPEKIIYLTSLLIDLKNISILTLKITINCYLYLPPTILLFNSSVSMDILESALSN